MAQALGRYKIGGQRRDLRSGGEGFLRRCPTGVSSNSFYLQYRESSVEVMGECVQTWGTDRGALYRAGYRRGGLLEISSVDFHTGALNGIAVAE